jgi:hypothetical protein
MIHVVDLENSFKENLSFLKETAQRQVGAIVSALQGNPFFEPSDEYLFERNPKDQSSACTHSDGSWDGWKLLWYYEYSSSLPSSIEAVVVELIKEAVELKVIRPRTGSTSA